MNISIVFTSEAKRHQAYTDMVQLLQQELTHDASNYLSDESPDIIHVFGSFDMETRSLLSRYRALRIPTVLTVCNALDAYTRHSPDIKQGHLHLLRRQTLMKASAIMAVGEIESTALQTSAGKMAIRIIANAAVTSTTTAHEMAAQMLKMYIDTIKRHDADVQHSITRTLQRTHTQGNNPVRQMCALLLYARYLNIRGQLTPTRLEQTARLLIATSYDEALLAQLLSKLHIKTFTAQLLTLMEEKELITEGFMPIPQAHRPLRLNVINTSAKCKAAPKHEE